MKTKTVKTVEYKDTFEFQLFPKYEYTILQKKRFVLFQGRANHYKSVLSYVDNFDNKNQINLVYFIGYNDRLRPAVMETKSNIVILAADIPKEMIETHDSFWKLIKQLQKMGVADDDGNIRDVAYKGLTDDEKKTIEKYREYEEHLDKYYDRYRIVDKIHPDKTISHDNLDKIIKRYYPFGVEQCNIDNISHYKSIIKVRRAIEAGFNQDEKSGMKIMGIANDKDTLELLRKNIKRCDMNINVAIREKGYANLNDIYRGLQETPYGWYQNVFYGYCFGYALSLHKDNHWITQESLQDPFLVTERAVPAVDQILFGEQRHVQDLVLFSEDGHKLANRFSIIFGVDEHLPVTDMVSHYIIPSIEEHTRYPIATVDDAFPKIFAHLNCLLDSNNVSKIVDYFNPYKCKRLHKKYESINEDVEKDIRRRYPNLTDHEIYCCTTKCSGWLWDRNTFEDTLELTSLHLSPHDAWEWIKNRKDKD